MEWQPKTTKTEMERPVALVQIGTEDKVCLVHLSAIGAVPERLKFILENPFVLKTGVGIQRDAKKLYCDWGISMTSCVDLSLLAKCTDHLIFKLGVGRHGTGENDDQDRLATRERTFKGHYKESVGLQRLVEVYHDVKLEKGKITTSNWEDPSLSEKQMQYAAKDAFAGFLLFNDLVNDLKNVPDSFRHLCPKWKYFSFDCIGGRYWEPLKAGDRDILCWNFGEVPRLLNAQDVQRYLQRTTEMPISFPLLKEWVVENAEYDSGETKEGDSTEPSI
ncbi:hypothetical protein VNI00_010350 [Paramarasmius palmivorus]|uniref:3'-5' exonuclease n=1 Tax=Paramarasmius palmivorus TaxID=297713 RepID=A0AAW0CLE2_9AGAR